MALLSRMNSVIAVHHFDTTSFDQSKY